MEYKGKVVLAYSGGLDTSVAIKWLGDQGYDVVTLTADVGQTIDLEGVKEKALKVGAVNAYVMDLRQEFVETMVWPALKANALYQGKYPLNSALSRPLIAKYLAWVADMEGAVAVAHGCTGKGQDQVRIEVCTNALNPDLKVIAPVRDWHFSRDVEIEYAKENNIPVPVTLASPYSIDGNLWGRSIECGPLEDPWTEPPSDAFTMTVDPWEAPDEQEYIEVSFEKGVPFAINGKEMDGVTLIAELNKIAGGHGVGRIDMLEDRLVGFKSREVYECPATVVLLQAHQALESMTLTKDIIAAKAELSLKYAELTYIGYWFSPLKKAFDAFFDSIQEHVTGTVRVRLYKGASVVVGIKAEKSLYVETMATYSEGDAFDHEAAAGFIRIWGLPVKLWRQVHPEVEAKGPELKIVSGAK
ncbi:MAG: argininosuccinate synthase [Thermovirgaceae bacterium]|jgi:argininosuccinate synthase|nr:argininosuccinate synthase [Synergistales bacterium]MDI9392169.1 argininosuccinate synthase [Synergistota bacterium]MDY0178381.1 argininosuccinate synthase [Synergistaceae bacterium]HRW87707.1 argininosuccinate synthase [Thermovirgaceae bacterium]MDD3829513.1 argininosuccinate synthase [Synergistales bacterium]